MGHDEIKQKVMAVFDQASEGYDNPASNYFAESARRMVEDMQLKGDERLLDVATGTGHVAVAAARVLKNGSVVGIDISEKMLVRARMKAAGLGQENVAFLRRDIEDMGFEDGSFDVASCAFGLFFLPDMVNGLRCISRVIKPGGRLYLTSFNEGFMEPLKEMLANRLKTYGVEQPGFSHAAMDAPEKVGRLLTDAGYKDVCFRTRQLGYYIKDARDWLNLLWGTAFRGLLARLSEKDLKQFTDDHLREVDGLRGKDGIWLNVEVLFTRAEV